MENKVYEIDGQLFIGCPNDRGEIECHITRDISEEYHLPNSFVYEDNDAEWRTLETVQDIMNTKVIAIGYTCIRISNGFSEHYLYVKVDAVLKYFENKLGNCKVLEDYYKFFSTYKDLFLALGRKENSDGKYF